MRTAKLFIVFILFLAPVLNVSAQDKTPKIIWKNVQEKYESFYDIKPVIVNVSGQPIYFPCSASKYGTFNNYGYDGWFKLLLNNTGNNWNWNVSICGFKTKEELKQIKEQERKFEKLKKLGRYIPEGCRVEPNQEFTINFSSELWNDIVGTGAEFRYYTYTSGKYKFALAYEWANAQNPAISESPAFFVDLPEAK